LVNWNKPCFVTILLLCHIVYPCPGGERESHTEQHCAWPSAAVSPV